MKHESDLLSMTLNPIPIVTSKILRDLKFFFSSVTGLGHFDTKRSVG